MISPVEPPIMILPDASTASSTLPSGRCQLAVFSTRDGGQVSEQDIAITVWDGMAAAGGRLYLSTQAGEVVCLGP